MNLTPWLLIAILAVPVVAVLFLIERPDLAPLIIGLAIPLEVLLVVALSSQAVMTAVKPGSSGLQFGVVRRVITALMLLGMSLFIGFVGVAVTGALAPNAVRFGGALACSGTVVSESTQYSYKPGQHGVAREFYCLADDGTTQAITGRTFVYSSLLVAAAALVVLTLLFLFVRGSLRRRFSFVSTATQPFTVTPSGQVMGGGRLGEQFEEFLSRSQVVATDKAENNRSSAAAGSGRTNTEERLAILERLYRSGQVTLQEYNAKRAEILADL